MSVNLETSSLSLPEVYEQLRNSDEPFRDGYCEYLISDSSGVSLTEEKFREAFEKIQAPEHFEKEDRTELFSRLVKEVDRNLEVVPIPRTLYDLFFTRVAIEEEVNGICPLVEDSFYHNVPESNFSKFEKKKSSLSQEEKSRCWHLICSTDTHPSSYQNPDLHNQAYRLNQIILKNFSHQAGLIPGKNIVEETEKLIQLLKDHGKNFHYMKILEKETRHAYGMAGSFGFHLNFKNRSKCWTITSSMRLKEEKDLQLYRNAVALEATVKNAYIFYRASRSLEEEKHISPFFIGPKEAIGPKKDSRGMSLSYGTSLLAGCMRDCTACIINYKKCFKRPVYAITVPRKEFSKSPYYVRTTPAIEQLSAVGEMFHPRSKIVWENGETRRTRGLDSQKATEKLKYDGTLEELASSLTAYQSKAILLTNELPNQEVPI